MQYKYKNKILMIGVNRFGATSEIQGLFFEQKRAKILIDNNRST